MTTKCALRIGGSLIVAAMLSIGAIIGAIVYMSQRQDQQELVSERAMVRGGLEAFASNLQMMTTDNAWWEECYTHVIANDANWISANVGSIVYDNGTIDLVAIMDRRNVPVYAWDKETGETSDPAFLDVRALGQVDAELAKLSSSKSKAQYVFTRVRGKPALLAFAKIVPVQRAASFTPAALPTLIMGYYLTPERVSEIGESFLIKDLSLVESEMPPQGVIRLDNPDGSTFGYLDWTPAAPGSAVLRKLTVPLALYLAAFLGVMGFIGWRTRIVALRLARSEKDAQLAAKTDRLSGLANRHGFLSHIESAELLDAARRGKAGIIFLDLNDFKDVNDAAGHLVGDRLIKQVAERLSQLSEGKAFLARIGGDEFAAVLTGPAVQDETPCFAEAMVRSFDRPIKIEGVDYIVGCSAGFALSSSERVRTFEQLLHDADTAMYHAKTTHADRAVRYHAALEAEAESRRALEADLRQGLKAQELHVEYQPLISTASGEVVSAEALVRWNSPKRGPVSPAQFIPVAEACGLIHEIGLFVLKRVCTDIKRLPGITVSVNVSPIQLKDPNFVDQFTKMVLAHGVETSRIEIELTENVLVENPQSAAKRLAALKAAGFKINLDDYGMGFSSLGYLQQLPIDKLKVDRRFVNDIGKGDNENKLLQSLVLMCESLNLEVVAEGVEREDQATLLKLLNFDLLQGWHTGRPMQIDALRQRLAGEREARLAVA